MISAFIKSVRGSDPDAAVYWLARMLESGEDLMFIARRLVILAGEDVGLADPQALPRRGRRAAGGALRRHAGSDVPARRGNALPGDGAEEQLGRARLRRRARGGAVDTRNEPVPLHLRNAVTGLMRGLGYGRDYRYSHSFAADDPERWRQQYLPENVQTRTFYAPGDQGFEGAEIRARLERIAALRAATLKPDDSSG